MLERFFHKPHVLARLEASLLRPWLEPYVLYLHARRHTVDGIQIYVRAVEHFGHWLSRKRIKPLDVNQQTVQSFLRNHLPHCQCPPPASTHLITLRTALRHLLCVIDSDPARNRPESRERLTPLEEVIAGFCTHLRNVCGLAEATCGYRARYVRSFLNNRFGGGCLEWSRLSVEDVQSFVASFGPRLRPGSIGVVASSLRSFLRWLQLCGHCTADLAAAVPNPPHWRLAQVPKVMTEEQVQQFLVNFDKATATGRRDYALAVCLVELGLRVGEVAHLLLEDVNWHQATIRITGVKERRARELPLMPSVGQALADYLHHGRPTTDSRHLFVRHRAPQGQRGSTELVHGVMRRAYQKVEGGSDWTGTHVLRHTAATRLHRHGASLKEVADVLGHRCLDTTTIYTKVDLEQLSTVAMPWPEVQS